MASTARLDPAAYPVSPGPGASQLAARALQTGWLLLLGGALAVAVAATPALHARYQTLCPQTICDVLPQPNAQTVSLLERAGIPLPAYASVMVAVEWLSMLVWVALGAVMVARRPRDIVALLLAYGGVVGASKAFLDALGDAFPATSLPGEVGLAVTAVSVPLILALFPDGRFVPRWARWAALAAAGYGMASLLVGNLIPETVAALELPLGVAPLVVLAGAQVYRYRRVSSVVGRQQTKWVLFGFGLFAANVAIGSMAFSFGAAAPFQLLFVATCYGVFLVVGVSVAFGILRYRLFAIDVILNRALVYGGLTAASIALYALVVAGLGAAFRAHGEPVVALVATGVVAAAFAPLRDRLQRGANRLLYGDRDDPYAALSRLGQRLEGTLAPETVVPAIVGAVTEALRLPYAAIRVSGEPVSELAAETCVGDVVRLPLVYGDLPVGELAVAPRAPGETFTLAERRLLEDLARQIGVAVHAVRLTVDLQRSRERLVSAREEERRRLRRDLHDGLGSQLAALALQAGALRATIGRDPAAAEEQAAELRAELRAAVADIRRLVHGLRPPALDELGLLGALRQRAMRYSVGREVETAEADGDGRPSLAATIAAPDTLPVLPAAVEVAAYRIVDEALANVAKHAAARSCVVCIVTDGGSRLIVQVDDDGVGIAPERVAGVGLLSMRERAEELGGDFAIGPRPDGPGTRVVVRLPLPLAGGDA